MAAAGSHGRPALEEMQVLYVDDAPEFAEMAATFLGREDDRFVVETAPDARTGLDRLADLEVDCIVSDYDMPGLDGIAFLERVRECHPDLPFILYTGKGSEEVASDAISSGVTDYLQKGGGTSQYTVLANRVRNAVATSRARAELEASQRRLELFFEQSPLGVVQWDEQFRVVRLNEAAETILGYEESELVGRSWEAIVPETDRDAVGDVVGSLLEDTGGYHSLNENVRGDGERVVCEWHNRVVTDADGDVVAIFSQFQDVTERKRLEADLAVRAEQYRTLVENLPETGVFLYDETLACIRAGGGGLADVGLSPADIEGKPPSDRYPPAVAEALEANLRRAFDGEVTEFEQSLDGRQYRVKTLPVGDGDGDIEQVLALSREVTSHRKRERALTTLQRRTHELMETTTPAETAELAVETTSEVLDVELAGVHLLDDAGATLEPAAFLDIVHEELGDAPRYTDDPADPLGTFVWDAFEAGESRRIDDFGEHPELAALTPARSVILHPLGDHGVFIVSATTPGAYDDGDAAFVDVVATALRTALDRVARERELAAERDRFRILFEELSVPVVEVEYDDAGEPLVQAVNPAFEEMVGADAVTLLGASVDDYLVPADREHEAERINDSVLDGASLDGLEVRRRSADGERTYLLQNAVYPDRDGGFAIYTDITERKRREQALETLHDVAQELMELETPAAVADRVVEAACAILGFPLSLVRLYDPGEGLVPAAVAGELADRFADRAAFVAGDDSRNWAVFESGERELHDDIAGMDRSIDADAGLRSMMLLPLGEHGVLNVGALEPAAFDDTDVFLAGVLASMATATLDAVERAVRLRAERDRFGALFEMVPDPVVRAEFVDGEPVIRRVNPAFEATFDHDADDALGESVNDLLVPADREAEATSVDATVQSKGTVRRELRRETADGLGDFLFRTVPIGDAETTDEYFGIYVDITDQKAVERRLAEQNDRLEGFASIVSHDLRNPLNVAQGRIELAREAGPDADEHFDAVTRALDRMDTLIDDLLALARHGPGEEPDDRMPVDLSRLVADSWASVRTDGATLEADLERTVRADRSRLQQLLENLFRNAVEHAGDEVTVTVGELPNGDGFYVADDGPGIPPDERETVFDLGHSSAAGGTGIGLSIVEQVADAHGWRVRVTESEAGGARFEVSGVAFVDNEASPS